MYKLTGTVKVLNPTQAISEKFSKREFVIETQDQYPQLVMFQATQDKCALLDNIQLSSQVEVSFNLRGKEWTSPAGEVKYFNTLEAWRIETVGQSNTMPTGGPSAMSLNSDPIPAATASAVTSREEEDDLPF